MAGMEVIDHQTVGSGGASSISFTSIPDTYRHLYVVGSFRSDASSARFSGDSVTFNDDTGSNYSYSALFTTGNAPVATEETGRANLNYLFTANASGSVANAFAAGSMWVLDYAATDKFTGVIGGASAVNDNLDTSDYFEGLISGHWKSTAAVNKITIASGSGNYVQYSEATLYGLNSAS